MKYIQHMSFSNEKASFIVHFKQQQQQKNVPSMPRIRWDYHGNSNVF